jgi:hypothetical protein
MHKQNDIAYNGIIILPKKKKLKTVPVTCKVTGTIFLEAEGCTVVKFLIGETMNAAIFL